MYKSLLIFITFCFTTFAKGQDDIKKYVQKNIVEIKSIQPDSVDFSDLEEIGNAIGDAKIVMLGEQDHGDAPTFLAKTRLIKYLHEKKDFNVLAFESDFFGMNDEWNFVQNGTMSIDTFIVKNIYPIWTQCDACKPLFHQYIPATLATNKPLQLTGFDSQIFKINVFKVLDSVLQNLNITMTKTAEYKSEILPLISSWFKYSKQENSDTTKQIIGYLTEIKIQMLQKIPQDNFWVMVVENLVQENIQFQNAGKDYWKSTNTRDEQMAQNLKWLNEIKYPNEKIIVWAHNYHVSKYNGHYPETFMNAAITMGSVFTEHTASLKNTYLIGFTSYEGTAGRLNSKIYSIAKPEKNSFENWIEKNYQYAFVDFKKYNSSNSNKKENFFMSGAVKVPYHKNQNAQWNHIFDGVFYIKKMYPCQR